jgi:hypothetical protein
MGGNIGIYSLNENKYAAVSTGTFVFWPSYATEPHYAYSWHSGGSYTPALTGSGMISFYRDDTVTLSLPAPTIDAWIVGTLGDPFTLDAEIVGREKTGFFYLDADLMKAGEQRGSFELGAHTLATSYLFMSVAAWLKFTSFTADAWIHERGFEVGAFIKPSFKVDAVQSKGMAGSFTVNAYYRRATVSSSFATDADIATVGDIRGSVTLDAIVVGPTTGRRIYLAALIAALPSSFTVGAMIAGWITLDAWVSSLDGGLGAFTVGAYIRGSSYIIFPDDGGAPTDPFGNPPGLSRKFRIKIEAGFPEPLPSNDAEINRILDLIAQAEDDLARLLCIPEAERLPSEVAEIKRLRELIADLKAELAIAKAKDPVQFYWDAIARMQTLINIHLSVPVSQRTPEQKAALKIDQAQLDYDILQYRRAREPKRTWVDITGDVIWSSTEFNQMARTGPGTFTITMKGPQPDFKGGEEIHFEIDDLRVFGGWVTDVQKDYFFPDLSEPRTIIHGTDYNILFDRLAIRNYPWEFANHGNTGFDAGPYRSWPPFKKGVMDSVMIKSVFHNYVSPDLPVAFDWWSQVDTITTPAPVTPWVMPEAGSPLRAFMQSVSMITTGVWYIDPYMVLHYHDRGKETAPYPLTDGAGGISSRGLSVTTDISSMINDIIIWGTLGKTVSGAIMVFHETGDGKWWERRYLDAIEQDQKMLMKLYEIPPSERTDWQNDAIERYKAAIILYKQRLADVRAAAWDPDSGLPRPPNAQIDSIGHWGFWQRGEFREDIFHRDWLNKRGHSILVRYDEPIMKAKATVWDPGYQAGQVVNVKSSVYGISINLVIRALRISFTVPKEPLGGVYYALPQYDLDMGLDPEAPWNIYDFLPYPGQATAGLRMDTTGGW